MALLGLLFAALLWCSPLRAIEVECDGESSDGAVCMDAPVSLLQTSLQVHHRSPHQLAHHQAQTKLHLPIVDSLPMPRRKAALVVFGLLVLIFSAIIICQLHHSELAIWRPSKLLYSQPLGRIDGQFEQQKFEQLSETAAPTQPKSGLPQGKPAFYCRIEADFSTTRDRLVAAGVLAVICLFISALLLSYARPAAPAEPRAQKEVSNILLSVTQATTRHTATWPGMAFMFCISLLLLCGVCWIQRTVEDSLQSGRSPTWTVRYNICPIALALIFSVIFMWFIACALAANPDTVANMDSGSLMARRKVGLHQQTSMLATHADVKNISSSVEDVKNTVSRSVEDMKNRVSGSVGDVKDTVSRSVENVKDRVSGPMEDVKKTYHDSTALWPPLQMPQVDPNVLHPQAPVEDSDCNLAVYGTSPMCIFTRQFKTVAHAVENAWSHIFDTPQLSELSKTRGTFHWQWMWVPLYVICLVLCLIFFGAGGASCCFAEYHQPILIKFSRGRVLEQEKVLWDQ